MFNREFLAGNCGFVGLPNYLAWERLFNVSYDLHSEIVKLYFLDETNSFLYKVSKQGITKQFNADKFNADPKRLSDFLGQSFNYERILIDTVEDDVFYVYLEEAPLAERNFFLETVCRRYGIAKTQLVAAVNRINQRQMGSVFDCLQHNGVAGVKIPLQNENCKIYARPFNTGNGFALEEKALRFLTTLYTCTEDQVAERIRYMWVSTEIVSGRMVLTTQHHQLVHGQ